MAIFKSEKHPSLRVDGVGKFAGGLLEVKGAKQLSRLRKLGHLGVVEVKGSSRTSPQSVPGAVAPVAVENSPENADQQPATQGPAVEPAVEAVVEPAVESAGVPRKTRTA